MFPSLTCWHAIYCVQRSYVKPSPSSSLTEQHHTVPASVSPPTFGCVFRVPRRGFGDCPGGAIDGLLGVSSDRPRGAATAALKSAMFPFENPQMTQPYRYS
jgi:hypothetical protein